MIAAPLLRLAPDAGGRGLSARRAPAGPALDEMLQGRSIAEVRRFLPAVFGLCRSVQEWTLALALGAPPPPRDALRRDMIRDHLALLCLHLPPLLGLAPLPLPPGWQAGGQPLRQALFCGDLPPPEAFDRWLESGSGIAPVLLEVSRAFAPGEAATALPSADPDLPFAAGPVENTPAARHAGHPLLAHIEAAQGHGPLAHLTARLIDLDALSRGRMPPPRRLPDGTALVPAARGHCALHLTLAGDVVTRFIRRTPTDDLLAPGGLLDCALAALPPGRVARVPLLIAILDPCTPLKLGGGHA